MILASDLLFLEVTNFHHSNVMSAIFCYFVIRVSNPECISLASKLLTIIAGARGVRTKTRARDTVALLEIETGLCIVFSQEIIVSCFS